MLRYLSIVLKRIGFGCGWAWPIMADISEGAMTDEALNGAIKSHFGPADDEARHIPDKLKLWIKQHAVKGSEHHRGDALLWFMTWECNRAMTKSYLMVALIYILFRMANQVIYSGLVNALGDSWPSSVYSLLHDSNDNVTRPQLLTVAEIMTAVLFSITSIFAAYISYKMDKQGEWSWSSKHSSHVA